MSSRHYWLVVSLSLALAVVLAPTSGAEEPAPVPLPGDPKIHTELVEYRDGDVVLEGYRAAGVGGEASKSRSHPGSPGVLVVPSWTGVNVQAKRSADRLARLGYVALVVDIYGKANRPSKPEDARKESAKYKADRPLTRSRMRAALERLRQDPQVDRERVAAIGYCFGGMCVLELARSGADVRAVVSFHGSLDAAIPDETLPIKARVLVCHGADDPRVTQDQVAGLVKEMQTRKAVWELTQYAGAVHSFTDEDAGSDSSKGSAYHPAVAVRAWEAMEGWLKGAWILDAKWPVNGK
jgi:dienelactone hydrolase